jgi:hypothetical protein
MSEHVAVAVRKDSRSHSPEEIAHFEQPPRWDIPRLLHAECWGGVRTLDLGVVDGGMMGAIITGRAARFRVAQRIEPALRRSRARPHHPRVWIERGHR